MDIYKYYTATVIFCQSKSPKMAKKESNNSPTPIFIAIVLTYNLISPTETLRQFQTLRKSKIHYLSVAANKLCMASLLNVENALR